MRKKKKQPIFGVLTIGLIVMSACLGICVYVVSILKNAYIEDQADYFQEHCESTGKALDDSILTAVNAAKHGASVMSSEDFSINNDSIKQVINLVNADNCYDMVAYFSDDVLYYNDGMWTEGLCSESVRNIWDAMATAGHGETVLIGNYFDGEEGSRYDILIAEPVSDADSQVGYFIVLYPIKGIFERELFDYQNEMGECYLIDKNYKIMEYSSDAIYVPKINEDFALGLVDYSDGRDKSKKEVQKLRNETARRENSYITIMNKSGEAVQVSYYALEEVKNAYFVCCYNANLLNDRIQPFLFKGSLSCIFVLMLMLSIVVYVWASNKKANMTIEKLAYEDSITKGKNINYFKEFALEVMGVFKETPFLIYRFDIANFRYINEAYGHLRADEVLKSCIRIFEEVFSDKELCVRMTADQFLAIIVNDKSLAAKMKEFKSKVNEEARSRGIKYPIKFKLGIYQVRKHDRDMDVLIDHANVARKTIVNSGNDDAEAFYSENIVNDMRKVDRIESDMQRALATGEFKVFYQPKWDVVADHVAGAEALVRWIKPDGSMVYPDEFIPIFERNGFIEKLDFYTLENVCEQIKKLLDEGRTVYPVSVNQSRVLIYSPDYVENVAKVIEKYNIPANAIELEVTETVFLDDMEVMLKTMDKLKQIGVRLSMDDFGSGYSSLNMLKDAPFNIIKIDRIFFSESITSDRSMWILQKIIEMINGLGLEVICEGVETGEQSALLRSIGCRMVQGYYYSKPIPADEYVERYC